MIGFKVLSTNNSKNFVEKYKPNGEIKFASVYFNSTRTTVTTHRFSSENSF